MNAPRHAAALGWLLVVAQFALLLAVLLLPPWPWRAADALAAAAGIVLLLLAALLGLWTLRHNRPGNFNVQPTPRARARLITGGPYRYIRHPMYLTVLLAALGLALHAGGMPRLLAALALWPVLAAKAMLEERLLLARWPEYAAYRARTRRLLPGLW